MKHLLLLAVISLWSAPIWGTPHNIASQARVTASSVLDDTHAAAHVTDGCIRVSGKGEWAAQTRVDARERVYPYPWIQLEWDDSVCIGQIHLYDRAGTHSHTAAGTLTFSDGSRLQVNTIPDDGAPKVVTFAPKRVKWVRFQVTDGEGEHLGLSEWEVFPAPASYPDPVSWVNPFIETAKGRYFFFVTGSLPFGMMSSAPLTRNINQGGGGYNYNSLRILGFPQLHNWMISGLSLMPVTGEVDTSAGEEGWYSSFSHDGEIAQPGYHRVYLDRYDLWTEQTVTDRTGFYRMTYTRPGAAKVLVSLGGFIANSTMINASATQTADNEIAGSFDTAGRVWGGADRTKVYFVVQFGQPIRRLNAWRGKERQSDVRQMTGSDQLISREGSSFKQSLPAGLEVEMGTAAAGDTYLLKTAISFVSIENARENLQRENPDWEFDRIRQQACDTWNEWLGRIEVNGGADNDKVKLYTDLWHVLLGRHKIDDWNGEYPDYLTGGEYIGKQTRIHIIAPEYHVRRVPLDAQQRPRHHMYNSDALWLTQWNLNTLWGLAYPDVLDDFAASLIEYDRQGGLLPRGPSAGAYTFIMTGCPATSLITSAYQRGITHRWNPSEGYRAMKRNHAKGGMLAFDMDRELSFYEQHGYCPNDAGLTIQWAFEDWALGQMAKKMGKTKDYRYYQRRASGWEHSFHPDLRLMMPRKENGEWTHTDPMNGQGFVQANAWQATFGLSHDLPGLARAMGGADSLSARLDYAFRTSADRNFLFGRVSYANQPGCSNAHVFAHVGRPWLTQYWVRRVRQQTYGAVTPEEGYSGNDEDQGQMAGVSALMSLGLFSVDGGSACRPCYDITSPLFEEIVIRLHPDYYPGKTFRIRTHGVQQPENVYIQRAVLNGTPHPHFQLPHSTFEQGGELELWLGPQPNKAWGIGQNIL